MGKLHRPAARIEPRDRIDLHAARGVTFIQFFPFQRVSFRERSAGQPSGNRNEPRMPQRTFGEDKERGE